MHFELNFRNSIFQKNTLMVFRAYACVVIGIYLYRRLLVDYLTNKLQLNNNCLTIIVEH